MGVTGIIAAVFAILALGLGVYLMSLIGENRDLEEKLATASRDLKKTSSQLDSQADKYQKKAHEASRKGSSAKDAKQRIAQLSDELSAAKSELGKSTSKVREFSGNLNKLRIEREELRQELAATRNRLEELGATAAELESLKAQAASASVAPAAPAAASPAPTDDESTSARKASVGRLERDLERSEEDRKSLVDQLRSLKRRLVATTADHRTAERKLEANRRAYIITQLQLDLLTDENYVLKHGTPPPFKQADKSRKREALRPKEEQVVPNFDAEIIDLPGAAPELEDDGDYEPEGVAEAPDIDEADFDGGSDVADDDGAGDDTVGDDATGGDATRDASKDSGTAAAAAATVAAPEPEPEPEPEKPRSVKLRKKSVADGEDSVDAAEAAGASAPPRPTAPPRPAAPPRPKV